MAKAIAIIDIPDGVNIEECLIDYEVYQNYSENDYQEIGSKYMVNLRPLPKKYEEKGYLNGEELWWERESPSHHEKATPIYAQGYNDCIDEILGEQNEM